VLALTGTGLLAAGCSSTQPSASHVSSRPSATASASPAGGPCASVRTTTPITVVPEACAELWAPYQVTEVPPPDILQQEHVPPAPKVVNRTNGAVSDADAQRWADASNRDSGWYKWAYAFDQPGLLSHLVGTALINREQNQALADGAHIDVPDCDLYPVSNALYPVTAQSNNYFNKKGFHLSDAYVFVVTYRGPCQLTTTYPDGHQASQGPFFTEPTVVFVPGQFIQDAVLGELWFGDAGGGCQDPAGPPSEWCGR
jgi:hypothetical protein